MALKKVRVQLLDEITGQPIEDVDVITSADSVTFADGETFEQKLNLGKLTGPKGPKGEKGDPGATGANGVDGSKIYNVTVPPATSLGVIGDWAINTTTADIYRKTASTTWTKEGNFKGPKGDTGASGASGTKGDKGDTGLQGPKGDKGDSGDGIKVGTSLATATERKIFFKVV